jgi:hypothetical protein
LRRYVLDIIVLTFAADFDKLNSALYDTAILEGTTTILCENERANLLALSSLVRKVHSQLARKDLTSITQDDKQTLCTNIFKPAPALESILGFFAIDIIAWYGSHPYYSIAPAWTSTLPGTGQPIPVGGPKSRLCITRTCKSCRNAWARSSCL